MDDFPNNLLKNLAVFEVAVLENLSVVLKSRSLQIVYTSLSTKTKTFRDQQC